MRYLDPQEWVALLPLLYLAVGASLIPLAALDRDQQHSQWGKWIRGAMYGMAFLAVGASFYHLCSLWASGAQPTYPTDSGIFVMDRLAQFGGIFLTLATFLTLGFSWDHFHQEGWVKGEYVSLLLFSVSGMLIFISTRNLLVLMLGLELMSLPLYALVAFTRFRPSASEGGVKYFLTGAVASAFFLMGMVLLYGLGGSLDSGVLLSLHHTLSPDPLFWVGWAFLLMGFFFKISLVPFHQWTPDAYEAASAPLAGFMSVATKGAALIALLRFLPLGESSIGPLGQKLSLALSWVAVLSMLLGNLAALPQINIKRMLAYSSIAHAGYLLLGFIAGTEAGHSAVLFYLLIYMGMNLGAFGILSALGRVGENTDLEHLRGLGWRYPWAGLVGLACFASLAGLPPFGGFFAKYFIFKELILSHHLGLALVAIATSLISVYVYLKPVVYLYLKPELGQLDEGPSSFSGSVSGASLWICLLIVLSAGLLQPSLVNGFAHRAIQSLHGR